MRTAICSFFVLAALVGQARATPYETFIDVDDQEDLEDLLAAGTITEDTYNELLDLLSRGVDLSRADRNELYALPNLTFDDVDAIIAFRQLQKGRIGDPAALVAAGALSEEKLLAISSFLIVRQPGENAMAAHGWIRAVTRATAHDFAPISSDSVFLPPVGLRTRFTAERYLTVGAALTNTRLEIGNPEWDPARGALVAEERSNQIHAPKAYVKWETNSIAAILGTYRAGFGQRLVFDNSSAYSPNGLYIDDQLYYSSDLASACKESAGELLTSPCTGKAGGEYVTPDFAWRDGLFGVAVGAKHLELSTGWLQMYAFGSASRRSIYQYELVNAGACEDPHDDADPACAAPNVYVKQDPLLSSSPRHSFATLPNVFQERLAGANFAYFADRRNSVGITAYGAQLINLVGGVDLDTQEWSRLPNGKKYGAVGANFSFGRDIFDVFGEAAASFDAMKVTETTLTPAKGGGGPAGILRFTITPSKREEIEVTARYYSTDYVNPHSRPISQSDEFEGQRARDEAGGRVRYTRVNKEIAIRALADVWFNPSGGGQVDKMGNIIDSGPKVDTYVRANVKTTPELWLGLWERYQDKDLSRSGHNQCFELSNELDESGETIPCGGRQIQTIVRGQYEPNRRISATLQLEHQLLDDNTQMELLNKYRQDVAAWFIMYYRPNTDLRTRFRLRYLDEAINDNSYLERSLAGVADAAFKVRDKDTLRFRLDGKWYLDKRSTTPNRTPNPELSLWLFYEAKL